MQKLTLHFNDGHLFVDLEGELWLFDTGAPSSFGDHGGVVFAGKEVSLNSSYMGLTAEQLSEFVGIQCAGLIGADILGKFDHIIDTAQNTLTVSTDELSHNGQAIGLSEFMGIPIIKVQISNLEYRMFFDTGAQISYFQDEALTDFPACGMVEDFYPGVGQFQTDTHQVKISLEGAVFELRCGSLPDLLGATLMMAGTQGIIGNQILQNRIIGYFPRRGLLCL